VSSRASYWPDAPHKSGASGEKVGRQMLKSSYVSSWGESWLQAANGRLHLTRHRVHTTQRPPLLSIAGNALRTSGSK